MADNTTLNPGASGDAVVTREISHAGDTAKVQGVFVMGISGAEGSYTAAAIDGDATNGIDVDVTRVGGTVAVSNAGLTELAAAINGSSQIDVNIAASNATVAVSNAGITTIAGAVSGSEMQVDVLTMPTVTVDLGANNDVTVTGTVDLGATDNAVLDAIAASVAGTLTVGSHAVTNGGTFATQVDGAALTALQLIDNPVAVLGTATYTEATTSGFVMGAVRRDADTTLVNTTNEIAPLIVDANGYLKVEIFDGGGSHTVDNGGTFAVQVDGNALTALQLIDDPVFADDAGYTLGTHKVGVIGGVAVATDGTDPTAVVEADAAALRTDLQRTLLVNQTNPRFWHVSADYASAQTNVSVKASPGASLSLYITDIVLSNGATAGNITLLDGSGGTVLFEIYPAINGGATLSLRNPIKLTAATALCLTSTTVTTHSIFVSGYIAP